MLEYMTQLNAGLYQVTDQTAGHVGYMTQWTAGIYQIAFHECWIWGIYEAVEFMHISSHIS
jgi:hypothetical protein